jgi:hypothetical protein
MAVLLINEKSAFVARHPFFNFRYHRFSGTYLHGTTGNVSTAVVGVGPKSASHAGDF